MSEVPVTLADMISEVRHECQMRRWVYSNAVAEKRMNRRQADRKIDVMDAVLRHLMELAARRHLIEQTTKPE